MYASYRQNLPCMFNPHMQSSVKGHSNVSLNLRNMLKIKLEPITPFKISHNF